MGRRVGGLQTTLRFNDSLGLIELRRAVLLIVTGYFSERIQIKIRSRK